MADACESIFNDNTYLDTCRSKSEIPFGYEACMMFIQLETAGGHDIILSLGK